MSTVALLMSDKRSGSTMFQRELCKHPDISHVEYSPHSHFETHHWLKGAVMLEMPPQIFSGGKRYPGYGSADNARTYLLDCVRGNVPDFHPRSTGKQLIFDAWDALCDKYANPIFFEKSPQVIANWASLSLILEWMRQSTRTVKIIGMTRNPMSVMYSAQNLFYTDPHKRQFGWLEIQRNLLTLQSMLSPENYLHCRYEDIIASPADEFDRVSSYLGVSRSQGMGDDVGSESLNKWQRDPEFDFELDESVKQMALQFGYSHKELDNPDKPGSSLLSKFSRRTKGQLVALKGRTRNQVFKPLTLRTRK